MTTDRNSEGAELLPCPFCGGEALEQPCQRGISYVLCAECGAESEGDRSKDSIAKWNRRASPPAAEVQALVDWLHEECAESERNGNPIRNAALSVCASKLAKLIPRGNT